MHKKKTENDRFKPCFQAEASYFLSYKGIPDNKYTKINFLYNTIFCTAKLYNFYSGP